MIRRIAIAVAALAFLGLLVFSLLSWRAAIAPIGRPTPLASAPSQSPGEKFWPRRGTVCLATSGQAVNHSRAGTG